MTPLVRNSTSQLVLASLLWLAALPVCRAIETITFTQQGQTRTVSGRSLARDAAGGTLLQSDDGALWLIPGDTVSEARQEDRPFVPATADQIKKRLRKSLPSGFRIYQTPHYLVAYNTSRDYAKWTASLLERLQRAFVGYWTKKGFELSQPEFPLLVTIYADETSYRQAAKGELGGATGVVGYYSLQTNRVTMYDLTGTEQARGGGGRRSSLKAINQMLATPAAQPLVATVVHEATHQIAFNCGLQQRYADLPLWLLEGMAVYFEAPDLSSSRGWRGIGKVNYLRLGTFKKNLASWNSSSLRSLIADSQLFRNPRTTGAAYADAWALNYYLIKHRSDAYTRYIKHLSTKKPLDNLTTEQRVDQFVEHFGELPKLQQDFLKVMSRLK